MANRQKIDVIPFDRAPFYFAPEYLATAEAWQATFRHLAEDALLENGCGGRITSSHNYSITVCWGALELTIDARQGTFAVWENDGQVADDDWISDSWAGHESAPYSFVDEIWSAPIPDPLLRSVSDGVVPFANAILRKMAYALEKALDEKRTEIRYFPPENGKQDLSSSGVNESYEPIPLISEKLFFVVLPRSTSPNITGAKTVVISKTDSRVKHDWKKIDLIIQDEYERIRLKTFRTRTELINAVEVRLPDKSPSRTMLHGRIKLLFTNF